MLWSLIQVSTFTDQIKEPITFFKISFGFMDPASELDLTPSPVRQLRLSLLFCLLLRSGSLLDPVPRGVTHFVCADIQVDKQHFRQTNWITIEWLETNKQKKSWMFIILYTCQPSNFSYLDLQSRTKCISYSALNSGITKSMANYSHAASSGPDVFNRVVCSFLLNLVNIFSCSY